MRVRLLLEQLRHLSAPREYPPSDSLWRVPVWGEESGEKEAPYSSPIYPAAQGRKSRDGSEEWGYSYPEGDAVIWNGRRD
jgi:hypothetical protein